MNLLFFTSLSLYSTGTFEPLTIKTPNWAVLIAIVNWHWSGQSNAAFRRRRKRRKQLPPLSINLEWQFKLRLWCSSKTSEQAVRHREDSITSHHQIVRLIGEISHLLMLLLKTAPQARAMCDTSHAPLTMIGGGPLCLVNPLLHFGLLHGDTFRKYLQHQHCRNCDPNHDETMTKLSIANWQAKSIGALVSLPACSCGHWRPFAQKNNQK